MSTTTPQVTTEVREPHKRAADRLRQQPPPVLCDPTIPARGDRAPRGDDRSHTPPHGDALYPHRLRDGIGATQ